MTQSDSSRPAALVTGGAGFIGSHVVRALAAQGRVRVVALDDLSGGFRANVPDGVAFIEGSILDRDLLARAFDEHRFRYVYHLAAYAAEGLSHFIRGFNYTNNVLGSIYLVNEAVRHEVECFVFTSSIAVYGAVTPPMREDQAPQPEDPYGIAKFAVEQDLRAAAHMFGLRHVVFRPHNVFGEYQNIGDPYRNVVGTFMNQVMQGRPLSIFGDGTQQRAFTYVGDVAPVIAGSPWVAAASNEIFNIGSGVPCTVNEMAEYVREAMGVPEHPIQHLPPRLEVQFAWSDHSKADRVFGASAQTPIAEGVRRMAAWAKTVGVQHGKPFEGLELTKNMPPSWLALVKPGGATGSGA